jgi:hypothetical protein
LTKWKVSSTLSDMETHAAPDAGGAAAQLAALQADRAAVADRAMQPWWYDAALGFLVFVLVAQFTLDNRVVSVVVPLLVVAGCLVLTRVYRRITGFFVSGLRGGATRRVVWIWLAGYAVVGGAGVALEVGLGLRGALVGAGLLLGVGFALLSRWWTRIYIAELRGAL